MIRCRLLMAFCCFTFWLNLAPRLLAQSAPAVRPEAAQIKARLDKILADPEFATRPAATADGPLQKAGKWLREKWRGFWDAIGKRFGFWGAGGSLLLRWVVIAALCALGAWVAAKLLTQLFRSSVRRQSSIKSAPVVLELDTETVTEPDIWVQHAQRYAGEQDYRRAFRAVFLATLLHLDRTGVIQYDRARTNGDYVRALRGKGLRALTDLLFSLSSEFDVRWYGHRATTESDYRRCLTDYERVRALSAAATTESKAHSGALATEGR